MPSYLTTPKPLSKPFNHAFLAALIDLIENKDKDTYDRPNQHGTLSSLQTPNYLAPAGHAHVPEDTYSPGHSHTSGYGHNLLGHGTLKVNFFKGLLEFFFLCLIF